MKGFKISKRIFNLSLTFAFLSAVFLSLADFEVACGELRQNVLRLHIVANSDSDLDQELKLKIRDALLEESVDLFEGAADLASAIKKAEGNTERLCETANRVIKENGAEYSATAFVGDSFFETRVYDDFTLPAGVYKSLIIKVGKAEGKNWWCVIFPEVCLPSAFGDLSDTVPENGTEIAQKSDGYIMRFKVVEIYEKIKNIIK